MFRISQNVIIHINDFFGHFEMCINDNLYTSFIHIKKNKNAYKSRRFIRIKPYTYKCSDP